MPEKDVQAAAPASREQAGPFDEDVLIGILRTPLQSLPNMKPFDEDQIALILGMTRALCERREGLLLAKNEALQRAVDENFRACEVAVKEMEMARSGIVQIQMAETRRKTSEAASLAHPELQGGRQPVASLLAGLRNFLRAASALLSPFSMKPSEQLDPRSRRSSPESVDSINYRWAAERGLLVLPGVDWPNRPAGKAEWDRYILAGMKLEQAALESSMRHPQKTEGPPFG